MRAQNNKFLFTHHKLPISYSYLHTLPLKMSEVPSIELWAAAKFVGRECATVNRNYLVCKKANSDPFACVDQEKLATSCAANV
ncbi:hypothetical protein EON65_17130 [archaeon]|nr:MAG: hypothetical protein EON65_17130 [archaeon]